MAKGVFWSLAGSLISRGLTLCAMILIARFLGKATFGELGIIQSTIAMLGSFAGFGLGLTATKYVSEYKRKDPVRAGRIIAISGFFSMVTGGGMALALLAYAPILAEKTINAPHLAGLLRVSALVVFIGALNGAQTGVLSGFEAFRSIARINSMVGLISFPVLLIGAYAGGLTGVVWALAASMCVHWLINQIALRQEARKYSVPLTMKNSWEELPTIWKFSLPAALAGIMVGPVNWLCSALLANQPAGYSSLGIYNAANQWFALLVFLPGLIGGVILPAMSEQLGRSNNEQSVRTLTLAIKINFWISAPLVFVAAVASPYIMALYGEEYSDGWVTLVITLVTAGLLAVQTPIGQFIAASGQMWTGLAMNLGWALTFFFSAKYLVQYGSDGLALARLVGYVVHFVWTYWFVLLLARKGFNSGKHCQ